MDDVEAAIVEIAEQIADQASKENWDQKLSTQTLLSELGRLGHSFGFYVCGSSSSEYGQINAWLYDHVWLKLENKKIMDVPLIVESEWSEDDFWKLLLGRAQHRVMIFQKRHVQDLYPSLIEQVQKFARTEAGDRYLLLGFDLADKKFKLELFVA